MTNTLNVRIKNAYKTEADWLLDDRVLLAGEVAYTSDKDNAFKVGDGTSKWSELEYFTAGDKLSPNERDFTYDNETGDLALKEPVFIGTVEEWEALSLDEKLQYSEVHLTNDEIDGDLEHTPYWSGTVAEWNALDKTDIEDGTIVSLKDDTNPGIVVSDSVAEGDMNPVSSNAVASATITSSSSANSLMNTAVVDASVLKVERMGKVIILQGAFHTSTTLSDTSTVLFAGLPKPLSSDTARGILANLLDDLVHSVDIKPNGTMTLGNNRTFAAGWWNLNMSYITSE